jgi:iron complex transport system substrate-binding protein
MIDARPHTRFVVWVAFLLLSGLTMLPAAADAQVRPQRIVSTNLCTDQILLRLVEPERIASLTYLSWERDATAPEFLPILRRVPQNHGLAEEVLMLNPDLVVGGSFSARFSNSLMQRLGKHVVLFDSEASFEDWYANIRKMGDAVGEPQRAEAMIAGFKARLAAMQAEIPPGEPPIYASLTVNNWMPGKDTLYTAVVNAGGFRTAGETLGYSGYRAIPLEQLIQMDIALISTGRDRNAPPSLARSSLQHPLLRMMADRALARVEIPARYIVCPTPDTLNMVRELVDARKEVDRLRAQRRGARAG